MPSRLSLSRAKPVRDSVYAILLCCMSGCAAAQGAHFDPRQAIDTRHGYRQHGAVLDSKSLVEGLKGEPDAGHYVRRAEGLGVLASLFEAAGGGLIGWPLGTKLGGGEPNWTLAYVGSGCIAVAIPLLIAEIGSYSAAVDAHNHAVYARDDVSARLESTTGWFKRPGALYSF
jgi:hypothetical protein